MMDNDTFILDPNSTLTSEQQREQHDLLTRTSFYGDKLLEFATKHGSKADLSSIEDAVIANGSPEQFGLLAAIPGANVQRLKNAIIEPDSAATHFLYVSSFPNLSEAEVIEQVSLMMNCSTWHHINNPFLLEDLQRKFPEFLTEEVMTELESGVTL